ncbi:MAG: triose-phosphate isomerase [Muribaculaceae bacterium]|nr:triose-phosphate isomerase [Muribaculaceae bacterium]
MRKNIVAGNWKMNTTVPEGIKLAQEVSQAVKAAGELKCDVIVGVPFPHLVPVCQALSGGPVAVAAENCADHDKGAYTGEVSAAMVASTGAQYVILGHSERRGYYNESIEMLKTKVDLALASGLRVIFCCGESLEERKAGTHFEVIKNELVGSLFHLSAEAFGQVVIAYEPIWAIGTGETATADQAEEIHAFIRQLVAEKYGAVVANDTTILYGGSCKPSNAPELFAKPDIDGGLIGGASLKAADFMGIVTAF